MLIQITHVKIGYRWNDDNTEKSEIQHTHEVWINPERVTAVEFDIEYYKGFADIHTGKNTYTCSHEDARRVIDYINHEGDVFSLVEERLKQQAVEEIEDESKRFPPERY